MAGSSSNPLLSGGSIPTGTLPKVQPGGSSEDLIEALQRAIKFGDEDQARRIAGQLAKQKLKVDVGLSENQESGGLDQEIRVKVYIEDRAESSGPFIFKLSPLMTVGQLKWKLLREHGFAPELQKWVIGQRLPKDTDTLAKCKVRTSGATIYLYLLQASSVGLTQEEYFRKYKAQIPKAQLEEVEMMEDPEDNVYMSMGGFRRVDETNVPPPDASPNLNTRVPPPPTLRPPREQESAGQGQRRSLPEAPAPPGGREANDAIFAIPDILRGPQENIEEVIEVGWKCPQCTYINIPTRPGCEMCAMDRPLDYVVPADVPLPQDERMRLEHEREQDRMALLVDPGDGQPQVGGEGEPRQIELTTHELDRLLRLNDLYNNYDERLENNENFSSAEFDDAVLNEINSGFVDIHSNNASMGSSGVRSNHSNEDNAGYDGL